MPVMSQLQLYISDGFLRNISRSIVIRLFTLMQVSIQSAFSCVSFERDFINKPIWFRIVLAQDFYSRQQR